MTDRGGPGPGTDYAIGVFVVDDEPAARRGVRRMLDREADFEVLAECADGPELLTALEGHDPDVLFLDIQMPGMDGFEALRRMEAGALPLVIFVSAYDRYAVRAFETHAVDYLLKPVDAGRFAEACDRVRRQLRARTAEDYAHRLFRVVEALEHRLGAIGDDERGGQGPTEAAAAGRTGAPDRETAEPFVARVNRRVSLVDPDDVLWISSARDYVRLHTAEGSHLIRETMANVCERLGPEGYVRIHRSTIVRLDAVEEYHLQTNGTLEVVLPGGVTRSVSSSGRKRLAGALGFEL